MCYRYLRHALWSLINLFKCNSRFGGWPGLSKGHGRYFFFHHSVYYTINVSGIIVTTRLTLRRVRDNATRCLRTRTLFLSQTTLGINHRYTTRRPAFHVPVSLVGTIFFSTWKTRWKTRKTKKWHRTNFIHIPCIFHNTLQIKTIVYSYKYQRKKNTIIIYR